MAQICRCKVDVDTNALFMVNSLAGRRQAFRQALH